MATTQDPSILTSLEIPFVTCVSVPVIRHGSMKSLCPSVSWLGFPGATRATRELVSYDAWEEKGGKMFCLLKIRYCKSCYSRVITVVIGHGA